MSVVEVKSQELKPLGAAEKQQIKSDSNTRFGLLEEAIARIFVDEKSEEIAQGVLNSVHKKIDQFIKENYGDLPRKTVYEVKGREVVMEEVVHEQFETVLAFIMKNEPVFLTGPAGSGKNVICQQVSKVLGLPFFFTNAVTQEYKLTGFTDAMGHYHESPFYKAFTQGGLFMLDEVDASIPEVLVILNAAISNKYFDFPAPIGIKYAHENFRIVAAGNTYGTGATYTYVGRNQLDGASLDRFALIRIGYSKRIEEKMCLNNPQLVAFFRDYRNAAERAGIQTIVSYRAMSRFAQMEDAFATPDLLRICLVKGLEGDDIRMICSNMRTHSKYRDALEGMAELNVT